MCFDRFNHYHQVISVARGYIYNATVEQTICTCYRSTVHIINMNAMSLIVKCMSLKI